MWRLKIRLSGGSLADFTRALRARKPDDWNGNVFALPEMELGGIVLAAARQAVFYDEGQAPTDEQIHGLTYDETIERVGEVMDLFSYWNKRQDVAGEEKKSSS